MPFAIPESYRIGYAEFMNPRRREIRTLADFLDVPEEELHRCLRAFRQAVQQAKSDRTDAVREGKPAEAIKFDTFVWEPQDREAQDIGTLQGTTPIEELPLRPVTRHRLRELSIYCLEDLSEVSESELRRMPDMGATMVARLRELLNAIGMDFKPNPNPVAAMYDRNRLNRKLSFEERARTLINDSHLSDVGFSPPTIKRALIRNYETVGELRALTLRTLCIEFGKAQVKEILETLKLVGLPLQPEPTKLDLWRHGLLKSQEMQFSADANSALDDLAPWIGQAAVTYFKEEGLETVGELVARAGEDGLRKIKGVGARTAAQTVAFLRERGLMAAAPDIDASLTSSPT
jgi:Phage integrase protein.